MVILAKLGRVKNSHLAQVCDLCFKDENESLRLGKIKTNLKIEHKT